MTDITAENNEIIKLVSQYIDLSVTPFNKPERTVVRVDKRDPMYGGNGIVYLLQMFNEGELTNNRIGAYMVFLNKGDQAGFHTHGTRNEEELYIVMHGEGEYLEMTKKDGIIRKKNLKKGSITAMSGEGFHSLTNTTDSILIVFVITTNNPK
ncbi:cupin domain-containing protein [Flavobacterium nitratireducens]|uniref:cupin domain-containing protein n=1 Tax=Flavobacterium nitratireducens TaxID=992289 RepID=UPI0024152FAD|nr:cupin domain-containing protein [Flavobacterium nitratireducens]